MGVDLNDTGEIGLLPIITLALWLECLMAGITGLLAPHHRPHAAITQLPPTEVQTLDVDITKDALPPDVVAPPAPNLSDAQPAAPSDRMDEPALPPLPAVAAPSASIAFAVPVEGPARLVPAAQAIPAAPSPVAATQAANVQRLTYGQGEGKQPAPEYPYEAVLARQEGTVDVRFSVDEDGHVTAAEAAVPCPWPLLNNSAVRTVRNRWRFSPGPPRNYEISFTFQLLQH